MWVCMCVCICKEFMQTTPNSSKSDCTIKETISLLLMVIFFKTSSVSLSYWDWCSELFFFLNPKEISSSRLCPNFITLILDLPYSLIVRLIRRGLSTSTVSVKEMGSGSGLVRFWTLCRLFQALWTEVLNFSIS